MLCISLDTNDTLQPYFFSKFVLYAHLLVSYNQKLFL